MQHAVLIHLRTRTFDVCLRINACVRRCIRTACNYAMYNGSCGECAMCRRPIGGDTLTRVRGLRTTILISRDFRVSQDGGRRWTTKQYQDNPCEIMDTYFHEDDVCVVFERYSPILDKVLWSIKSNSKEKRAVFVRIATYFPHIHGVDTAMDRLREIESSDRIYIGSNCTDESLMKYIAILVGMCEALEE